MSWNVQVVNAPSKEEAKRMFEEADGAINMPVFVHTLCEQAIDLIPSFDNGTPDPPATGYSMHCHGQLNPEGTLSTSHIVISVGNNFVTNLTTAETVGGVPQDEKRAATPPPEVA